MHQLCTKNGLLTRPRCRPRPRHRPGADQTQTQTRPRCRPGADQTQTRLRPDVDQTQTRHQKQTTQTPPKQIRIERRLPMYIDADYNIEPEHRLGSQSQPNATLHPPLDLARGALYSLSSCSAESIAIQGE